MGGVGNTVEEGSWNRILPLSAPRVTHDFLILELPAEIPTQHLCVMSGQFVEVNLKSEDSDLTIFKNIPERSIFARNWADGEEFCWFLCICWRWSIKKMVDII